MSQFPPILNLQEDDLKKMLACHVHLGSDNISCGMDRYVTGRNEAGNHIIDLRKTWEKLTLAARAIVAVENPADVCVIGLNASSGGSIAQRAVLKFGKYIGAKALAGRFTPGTLTNHVQSHFFEPTLLILSDPFKDHQPLMESSYMNIPVIAFCNSNHSLRNIDIAIPCNTEGANSVALMYWLLAREVLRLQGRVARDKDWEIMVDMFIYRDPEEADKQEEERRTGTGHTAWAGAGGADWEGESPVAEEAFAAEETWAAGGQWDGDADAAGAAEYLPDLTTEAAADGW
jgi:small subunit ribosomal protein SAe